MVNSEDLKSAASCPTVGEGIMGRFGVSIVCRSIMFYKPLSYLNKSYISCLGSNDNKCPMPVSFYHSI